MKKRWCSLFLLLVLILTLFAGCGGSSGAKADSSAVSAEAAAADSAAPMPADGGAFSPAANSELPADDQAPTGGVLVNAKVILTADLNAETQQFEQADQAIRALVKQSGGYLEYSSAAGNPGSRYASYTIRVPRETYAAFLNEVGTLCAVTDRSESAEDISEQYFDRETRLKAQTTKRDRLLTLLARAEKMEDIIALESALADVQTQIEALTGELRRYDSLVDFATIHLSLSEVRALSDVPDQSSFLSDVTLAFRGGTRALVAFCQGVILLLVGGWPFFLLLAAAAVAAVQILRKKHILPRRTRNPEKTQDAHSDSDTPQS